MEKITKEYNVYSFEELSEEVKEKLIQKEMEEQQEFYCNFYLEDEMGEKAEELLKKYFKNATFKKVYYSLSYSQGSGSMIEFIYNNFDEFNTDFKITKNKNKVDSTYFSFKVMQYGRYYHERSFNIDYYVEFAEDNKINEKLENKIDKLINEELNNKIIEMNEELTKYGYSLIEYYNVDNEEARQDIINILSDNKYLIDGTYFE